MAWGSSDGVPLKAGDGYLASGVFHGVVSRRVFNHWLFVLGLHNVQMNKLSDCTKSKLGATMSREAQDEFAQRLRSWINANFGSLKDFCEESRIKYYTLQHYLRSTRNPSEMTKLRLKAMGFDFEDGDAVHEKPAESPDLSSFCLAEYIDTKKTLASGKVAYHQTATKSMPLSHHWIKSKGLQRSQMCVFEIGRKSPLSSCSIRNINISDYLLISREAELEEYDPCLFFSKEKGFYVDRAILDDYDGEWANSSDFVGIIVLVAIWKHDIDDKR